MRKLFHGTVLKGKLILTEQSAYNTVLRSLESKEIELSIGTIIRHRSNYARLMKGTENKLWGGTKV